MRMFECLNTAVSLSQEFKGQANFVVSCYMCKFPQNANTFLINLRPRCSTVWKSTGDDNDQRTADFIRYLTEVRTFLLDCLIVFGIPKCDVLDGVDTQRAHAGLEKQLHQVESRAVCQKFPK